MDKLLHCLIFIFCLFIYSEFYGQKIYTDEWKQFAPSAKLPSNVHTRNSNNNVDLVRYKDKFYVAFRTAPTHFASKKTKIYIISSTDFQNWKYEADFFVGADMREPRFAIFHEQLHLYFFEGGKKMFRFEPKYIWATTLRDTGWSDKMKTNLDGFVDWRFRTQNDKLYLSAYYGFNLYNSGHHANLRLFTSEDGLNFMPLSEQPQVTTLGAEEGEFIFDKEGNIWSTVRLEGSGSYLCFASKDSLGKWTKKFSKLKYDSALLLDQDDDIFLISRRHLKGDATQVEIPNKKERRKNLIRYSFSKKVTALFKINKEKMEIDHVMDFPSTGDTAYPAVARADDGSYYVLNYSSNINKRKKIWIGGQLGKTYLYQTQLHFK